VSPGASGAAPAPREATPVTVIGGGLAGCEAAWALAELGHQVQLREMRPVVGTPAHQTDRLAELVCSNSFKSTELHNAHGLLKAELTALGSLLLEAAQAARVPAGAALAVDRAVFSGLVEARILSHPRITVLRGEVTELTPPAVIATGPLTSPALAAAIARRLGGAHRGEASTEPDGPAPALSFYDAIAPIVSHESLDLTCLFPASRYGKGEGSDYLNAPLTREQYQEFVAALIAGDQFTGHAFDQVPYFEGCLPIEEMARRGVDTLRFGPLKPVGLPDPRTGRPPYAVVQLRREDRAGQMWNLVGFQTRLRIPEQDRVFRMIPGFQAAEFLRHGSIHRNTYINSPATLGPALTARDDDLLFFAGQCTGVEGYTESLGTGLLAGLNLSRRLARQLPAVPPATTMLGGLYRYLREADPAHFQPMNANFGLLDPLDDAEIRRLRGRGGKDGRKLALIARAQRDFQDWLGQVRPEARRAEGVR
jgi:methylenetetrahydrofolate--tRNA-(uracil-5-)-methyltransferase